MLITAALACSKSDKPPNPGDATVADTAHDVESADALCRHPAVPETRICCGMPDEVEFINCYPRQLIEDNLANCVTEGRSFDAKFSGFGLFCCAGLTRIEDHFPTEAGAGRPDLPAGCAGGPPGSKRCTKCGDGTCGPGENRCNCPDDCRS